MYKKYLPALTIFLGSFLIFGVQPMLGRTLLPAFGGTAAVWVVCLASFQMLLLAGYFYAHRVSGDQRSEIRGQRSESGGRSCKNPYIVLLALAKVLGLGRT
jgi:glucose dehydrogenase